jgi:hypothetical protein
LPTHQAIAGQDLRGVTAIVTGANHGIGEATARLLAARGASVLIAYLRLPIPPASSSIDDDGIRLSYDTLKATATGEDVAQSIRDSGGRAVAVEADLVDPAAVQMLFDEAERRFDTIEVLVNNADHCLSDTFVPPDASVGLSGGGDVKRPFSPELFLAHARVNCVAPAHAMAEFAKWVIHLTANGPTCWSNRRAVPQVVVARRVLRPRSGTQMDNPLREATCRGGGELGSYRQCQHRRESGIRG